MEFNQLVPGNTSLSEPGPGTIPDKEAASLRFLAAQTFIRVIQDELQRNAAFTRALAGRYFMAVDGMKSGVGNKTFFSQGDREFAIGHQLMSDEHVGFHEALEFMKIEPAREDRLSLETHEFLGETPAGHFCHDGSVVYQKTDADGSSEIISVDTAEAAHALICGLIAMSPRAGEWLFG